MGYYPVKNKKEFLPITDEAIKSHLQGYKDFTVGIYPLLQDDATNFLAIDFDGEKYKTEVKLFSDICKTATLSFWRIYRTKRNSLRKYS